MLFLKSCIDSIEKVGSQRCDFHGCNGVPCVREMRLGPGQEWWVWGQEQRAGSWGLQRGRELWGGNRPGHSLCKPGLALVSRGSVISRLCHYSLVSLSAQLVSWCSLSSSVTWEWSPGLAWDHMNYVKSCSENSCHIIFERCHPVKLLTYDLGEGWTPSQPPEKYSGDGR